MNLTAHEQRLLDFSREQFGEHLSQFLLTGLGEQELGRRWRFTMTYADDERVVLKRRVEGITYEPSDGSSFLPQGRHPLVLAALLHLLLTSDQASQNTLHFEHEEMLNLLGWKNTRKANKEIDEAIERYFMLTYKWKMNKKELSRKNLAFFTSRESLISEFGTVTQDAGRSGEISRVLNRIVFNLHFIEQLQSQSLFGIDWKKVQSLTIHTD